MNNFIVSARKYRPATFKTVVGQDYIVTTLKNAVKNKQLAQAFLFTGPRGVGKTTCARILAKTINCTNLTDDFEACNECESCRSFNQSASFNVHELDAASNNSVDDIRSLVDQVRIPPQAGLYKVYIIDEVHMLSAAAFNAFLKTLEEPPAYAKFILATTEKHKIIPTILSRCQVFDFKRIRVEDIAKHLAYVADNENIQYEAQALHIIATKSDGALRDALSIFDQLVSFGSNRIATKDVIENLNILDYEFHFRLVKAALAGDTTSLLLTIDEIFEKGFEGQALITGYSSHLRSLLVCKDDATLPLLEVHENIAPDYLRQSKSCSAKFLIKALDLITQCDIHYKAASNKRFHIELSFLKIAFLNDSENATLPPPEKRTDPDKVKPIPHPEQPKAQEQPVQTQISSADKKEQYGSVNDSSAKSKLTGDFDDMSVSAAIMKKAALKPSVADSEKVFNEDDVQNAYENFCIYLRENENKMYESSVIKDARFEKADEKTWKLILASAAEVEAFRNLDIQAWFREKLSNKSFSVQLISEAKVDNSSVLTKEDKVRSFISKYPQIQKFMEDLDAHPDI